MPWDGVERRAPSHDVSDLREEVRQLSAAFTSFVDTYGPYLKQALDQKVRRDVRLAKACDHVIKWGIGTVCSGVLTVFLYAAHQYLATH